MAASSTPTHRGSVRLLRLRKRPDLVAQRQEYLGRRYWVVKDPVALKYYRFEEEEYELLVMMDGNCSLEELQCRFEKRFSPQKITLRELHQLVGMLHRSSLVVADASGQGEQLLERKRRSTRSQLWNGLANVLSLRFRMCDPDRFLDWLVRYTGWFFSSAAVIFHLVLAGIALLIVASQFDVFRQKLPGFHEFFATQNWLWLAVALGLTKVLHEFGHGLCCKRFGGQCHEMGVMLLVMTPCLYCNVTDSWMLPNKWRRAAIGAAGMYVELVLATYCTFLWWFSAPGLLHYLCLNVMFVGSVSTLVFNVNPLLRYDGYYILSDILEIPNLRQKASALLQRRLSAWVLGVDPQADPFLPVRYPMLLSVYAVASTVYRWVVTIAILWFLHLVFRPYGFQIVGQLLAVVAFYGALMQPLWRTVRFFSVPGRSDRVKTSRVIVACSVSAVAVSLLWVPLPHFVRCSAYVEPGDATTVYAESAGQLRQIHARPGDWVRAGQSLVTLDNVDIRLALLRIEDERHQLARKLEGLQQRAFDDEQAAMQIAEVEEAIAALDEQRARRQTEQQRLCVSTPVSGVILPPATLRDPRRFGQLPFWSGSPFEQRNINAFLAEGVTICHVGDPCAFRAVLAIDQKDLEFVHVGQPVDLVLAELPSRRFHSRLEQLSLVDMKVSPDSLSSRMGGTLRTHADANGQEHPVDTTYQASAPLVDQDRLVWIGATGEARIRVGSISLARWMWRYVCHTFHFVA